MTLDSIDQILEQLRTNNGHFPKQAVREAIARRDEMTPALLDVLRDVAGNPEPYLSSPDTMVHLYAMHLLAQFREGLAYPLLVQIFSLPGDAPFDLAEDTVTDGLGRILASVSNGDPSGMKSLIEDSKVNSFVRDAAMTGLLTLVACGEQTREEVVAYFRSLFLTLERKPDDVWSWLASVSAALWPDELMDVLRSVWKEGLFDEDIIDWPVIEAAHALGKEVCLQRLEEHHKLVTDVVEEMAWWACFHRDRKAEVARKLRWPPFDGVSRPIQRVKTKIGRNEPCPCGSGKKFKKCCGG